MKLNPFCMCCAINKQEKKIRDFDDADRKTEYMKKVMELMANAGEDDCAPSISIDLKKMFSDFWEQPMEDYSSIKKEFNQLMLDLDPSLEETIRNSDDPLKTALLYARIGNYIDFAALANVDSATVLSLLNEENKDPLDENEYRRFREELASASRLVYLTDNCGEVVLDKLVVKLLKEFYPELAITVIVRGFPAINDATMEDAEEIGLTEITRVIGNGNDVGGTWLPHISEEARKLLETADLIIAKGQGNYETLHECGLNIYYLFLCKCEWFHRQFHAHPLEGMFINERRI